MKESELIALLNLYIDNEIGADDAVRLESEVTNNPGSRRIYRQYCRMHKACVLLAEQSGQDAPAEEKLVAFAAPRRGWSSGMAAAGLMAAAACVALIVAERRQAPSAVGVQAASAVVPQSGTKEDVASARDAAASAKADLQPVFTVRSLTAMDNTADADLLPAAERDSAFAWMNSVQLAPIQRLTVNPMVFGPPPVFSGADAHAINASQSLQQQPAERVSFQFQK